jgi:hypothetical protein
MWHPTIGRSRDSHPEVTSCLNPTVQLEVLQAGHSSRQSSQVHLKRTTMGSRIERGVASPPNLERSFLGSDLTDVS